MTRKPYTATLNVEITKADDDQHMVYGWLSVAKSTTGALVVDLQGDMIEPAELIKAAHGFMLDSQAADSNHDESRIGKVVESIVTTEDTQLALGIPPGTQPVGWFVGVKILDDDVWARVKSGELAMFSIGAEGWREEA